MPDRTTLEDLDARIATIRENLRQLVEQATGSSGASNEDLTADRIAEYEQQLAAAVREREALR